MMIDYSSLGALLRCLILCIGLNFSLAAHATLIVTVTTSNNTVIAQTLNGINTKLPELVPNSHVVIIDSLLVEQVPELVLALGSKAVKVAQQQLTNVPLLACLLRDERSLKAAPNAYGVVMRHSVEQQLYWLERMLPNSKKIGILYSPKHNKNQMALITKAAEKRGLNVFSVPVNNAQDLPSALKAIKRNADSILAITDPIVYSSKTAKGVLLFSFRNKIPLVGLSKAWVKAGALYALDWDYYLLGEHCATEAAKILAGQMEEKFIAPPSLLSRYIINERTAKAMKLTLDQSLIDGASFVFK